MCVFGEIQTGRLCYVVGASHHTMKIPVILFGLSLSLPAQIKWELEAQHPAALLFQNRPFEKDRLKAIETAGGEAASEETVLKSLRYLKNTQEPDGSWSRQRVGMTGLGLLTFLGQGRTAADDEFGETILAAIIHLTDTAEKYRGKLASDFKDSRWPYEHAIATYAMTEAYLLCCELNQENIPSLEPALELCGQFLINSQGENGGWNHAYQASTPGHRDISLTSWHLLALRSLELTGFKFRNLDRAKRRAQAFLVKTLESTPRLAFSKTAAAAHALQFSHSEPDASEKLIPKLVKSLKFDWDTADSDLYGNFFAAQALFHHDEESWASFQKLIIPSILKHQSKDGSFQPVNQGNPKAVREIFASYASDSPEDTHYRSCLATLILQTYYRHRVRL